MYQAFFIPLFDISKKKKTEITKFLPIEKVLKKMLHTNNTINYLKIVYLKKAFQHTVVNTHSFVNLPMQHLSPHPKFPISPTILRFRF